MRCCLAVAVITLLLSRAAAAEPVDLHLGYGVAPGGHLGGDLARKLDTGGHVGGRIYFGARHGGFGLEASLAGTDATVVGAGDSVSTFALAIEARAAAGLTSWLRLYVRGGPSYAWLGDTDHVLGQFSGLGLVYGTGLEASLARWVRSSWGLGANVWLEHSRQHLDLSSGPGELDGTIGLTLLGVGFSAGR